MPSRSCARSSPGHASRTCSPSAGPTWSARRSTASAAHGRREAAKADRGAFLAWHAVRTKLTPEEEAEFTTERAKRIAANEDAVAVDKDIAAKRAKKLAERRFLIENRLTVQAIVDV